MVSVFEKWKSYGLLEGLDLIQAIELSETFEMVANRIICNEEYYSKIDVLAFPPLRRVKQYKPYIELNHEWIDVYLDNLFKFTNSDYYKDTIREYRNVSSVDAEAELLNEFVKQYYDIIW